jgi:hypothetical protein
MEPVEPDRPRGWIAPLIMAAGGVIGMVGSFLTWLEARRGSSAGSGRLPGQGRPAGAGRSLAVSGLDTTNGRLVLGLLIALVLVSVVAWMATRFSFTVAAVTVGLVLGTIVLVLTITALVSPDTLVGVRAARLAGAGITVTAGVGLYFALVGSALSVAAGGSWLLANRKSWAGPARAARPPTAASPPPPPPDLGEEPTRRLPPLTEPGIASE